VHTKPNIDSQVHRNVYSLHIGMFIFEDFLIGGGWDDFIAFVNLVFLDDFLLNTEFHWWQNREEIIFLESALKFFLSNLLYHLISEIV